MITITGYLASLLLALSLLVNNDLKFRWFNTFGCIAFIVYGILINAFPIILTNTLLLCINVFYLVKIYRYRSEEDFDLLPVSGSDPLVQKFLSYHQKDIKEYFPGFTYHIAGNEIMFFVLRDMALANLFIATLEADGRARVQLNYTVPRYRDFKVGRYIFEKEKNYLRSQHIAEVYYTDVQHKGHENFVRTVGFTQQPQAGVAYAKKIE